MQHQLAEIVRQFESARRRVEQLAVDLPELQWATRRDQRRWSVAECIAHLNLTAHAYVPLLRAAFAQNPSRPSAPASYRRDLVGWLIGWAAGPLPHIGRWTFGRVRTAAAFVPSGDLKRDRLLTEFNAWQDEQIEITTRAEGCQLTDIRIHSPFDRRISYNAYSCLVLLPRHQRRHLWQAEQIWSDSPAS